MTSLDFPWPGLAAVSARVDLWPVLRALHPRWQGAAPAPDDIAWAVRKAGLHPAHQEAVLTSVADTPPWRTARHGVRFLCAGTPGWPGPLTDLPRGPVALSVEGDTALLARPIVAIVGARACTSYGREWAARLAAAAVDAGAVVVSGLAAGIDLAAHTAAGGATIAVLGQGLDAPMSGWQRRARTALLAQGGLVVSELPPETHASTYTFPVRNRIIAGLASVVAVVEAGERSGTRNTATRAFEYKREVLALPGPLGAPASVGCIELLSQGATVIRGVETLIEAAGLLPRTGVSDTVPGDEPLLRHLDVARTPDELVARMGASYADVMARLGMLELTGRVVRMAGRRYMARTNDAFPHPTPGARAARG